MRIICNCGWGLIGFHDKQKNTHVINCVNGNCTIKTKEHPTHKEALYEVIELLIDDKLPAVPPDDVS